MTENWKKLTNIELLNLKAKLSYAQISVKFAVHINTVKRRIKRLNQKMKSEKSIVAICRLKSLASQIPPGTCRNEIYTAVKNIVESNAKMPDNVKKHQILFCLKNGKNEIIQIVKATGFDRSEAEKLLKEMITEKTVTGSTRGSHGNKGRKLKFLYFDTEKK
jgi:IS30 family transposase